MLPPWTPDLASLDLLLSVAETGSLGKAATAHGISQPSASTRLAHLERRLGVTLLVRSTTGSTLTPAGEAVLAWAAGVVDAARALTDGVLTLRADRDARLRVAASLTVAEYLLPAWLLTLRRRHDGGDDLDVSAVVENSAEVTGRVRAGDADLGFIESPGVPSDLTGQQVGTDALALVVSPAHPLATTGTVTVADLPGLPLLLREPGSGTRDTFLRALATGLDLDEPPAVEHTELGSTTTLLATARAGGGVAVLSVRAVAADLAAGTLAQLDVPGFVAERPLTAIWKGSRAGSLARELVEIAARAAI